MSRPAESVATIGSAQMLRPLFFLSGVAGLGYQIVWTKQFTAGLGHELPALLAVVSAFFGGLALGGWKLDRRLSRSASPRLAYAKLEGVIGGWAVVSALLIPLANQLALQLTGPQPAPLWQGFVAFAVPFLTLLPATAAMGATLPAMERWLRPFLPDRRCLATVYALNTAGAVAGTLLSAFVLMPGLGLRGSLFALAALNFLCAALAVFSKADAAPAAPARSVPLKDGVSDARLRLTLFVTGLLGIGFEIVGVRALSQVLENTLYTFAAALSVYLVGTALGAALYQRFGRGRPFTPLLGGLLGGLVTTCSLGLFLLSQTAKSFAWCRAHLPDEVWAVALAEMLAAATVFGLPTVFMGALFAHLTQASRRDDGGIGHAFAWNTLGGMLAGPIFGAMLLPVIGLKWTFISIAFGYLLLLPTWRNPRWPTGLPLLALTVMVGMKLQLITLPPGAKILEAREGRMTSVVVSTTPDGHRALRVNNRFQMGGTAAALAERRQAHLPLLLHPAPKRALFLGPGTGITLGAAGLHPGLVTDGVELLPEVIAMMRHFEPENEGPLPKPGVNVLAADARRFVRTTAASYDVIVADLFHPAQDGAGLLYTREHFEAVRQRLNPGGLFCQWLPLHQMDEPTLRLILRTFLGTFSQTRAFLLHFNVDIPVLGLVGSLEPMELSPDWLERRLSGTDLAPRMKAVGLDRTLNLLGCLVGGPKELEKFAGDAPLCTDNEPHVTFAAPRFAIQRQRPPQELLMNLLGRVHATPSDLLDRGGANSFTTNLTSFFAARDIYLKGLVAESEGHLSEAIDAYLESARRSLHFTPGYARCVGIVQMLAGTDRAAARQLYQRLEAAQPAQPLGRKLLAPLFEEAPEPEKAPKA